MVTNSFFAAPGASIKFCTCMPSALQGTRANIAIFPSAVFKIKRASCVRKKKFCARRPSECCPSEKNISHHREAVTRSRFTLTEPQASKQGNNGHRCYHCIYSRHLATEVTDKLALSCQIGTGDDLSRTDHCGSSWGPPLPSCRRAFWSHVFPFPCMLAFFLLRNTGKERRLHQSSTDVQPARCTCYVDMHQVHLNYELSWQGCFWHTEKPNHPWHKKKTRLDTQVSHSVAQAKSLKRLGLFHKMR